MIHQQWSPDGVHPPNQFVPRIVRPLPCSSGLVRHILLFVYFFEELISFIGSLNKCHISVFNVLIFFFPIRAASVNAISIVGMKLSVTMNIFVMTGIQLFVRLLFNDVFSLPV